MGCKIYGCWEWIRTLESEHRVSDSGENPVYLSMVLSTHKSNNKLSTADRRQVHNTNQKPQSHNPHVLSGFRVGCWEMAGDYGVFFILPGNCTSKVLQAHFYYDAAHISTIHFYKKQPQQRLERVHNISIQSRAGLATVRGPGTVGTNWPMSLVHYSI